jgi:5'-3' exoribonuclease 1
MAKLSRQLKYFINKKVSEDRDWQQPEIVLSGHEVPGEGEHKIMEYIRNARAQPDYNPNVRHCLYGLDADLIMLGLLSHDPHFCLLREEVTFGRQSKNKSKELEHQNFYLMHLCIVREYLELEFQELKAPGAMSFTFDMEKVIDDFILMAFFVGNDFLPNLPHLHINEGALATMFRIYKAVLPKCDGYINENGKVNLQRLGLLLDELGKEEFRFFEHENEDASWLRGKRMLENDEAEKTRAKAKGKLIVSSAQKALWKQKIRKFLTNHTSQTLDLGADLNAADRKFVQDLAEAAHLEWATKPDDEGHRHLILSYPARDEEDEEDEEAHSAVLRIVKRYDNAQVLDLTSADAQAAMEAKYKQKFQEWKDEYYYQKFEDWTPENKEEELRKLTENYVQGLQWVLYYYYRGIASWPWFYGYHYSPMISDVMKGLNADLNFKLGQPFKPNEQLMGVLPDRSKKIVPTVYWELMTDPNSPIIDFYPRDFELDMNGKKMDWEAVVKIPFIDEKRLLAAMAPKDALLSDAEKARNDFGVALKFTYSEDVDFVYPSSLEGVFPPLAHCHCVENIFDLPPVEGLEYRAGLTDGALLNIEALAGFPTLATLPYVANLGFHGVNVFQQDSRNESMIVTLLGTEMRTKVEAAKVKLGQRCFVGYPFLQEAKIVKVSDELFDYTLAEDGSGQVVTRNHSPREIEDWSKKADRIENFYSKRLGILIGPVESLVSVHMLKGLIKTDEGATIKEYGEIPGMETEYASQIIVDEVVNEDERFIEKAALPVEEEFPLKSVGFFLGDYNYGQPLEVGGYSNGKLTIWLAVMEKREPDFAKKIIHDAQRGMHYMPSYMVAKQLDLHPLTLSKITSSYFIRTVGDLRVNLGLNLKFEARKQKVLGYSRKSETGWEFSPAAVHLIVEYMQRFPDFFAGVKRNPSGAELNETDLWADPTVASARVKEIGAWLKTLKTSSMERVPLDAEQLDSDVVMRLATEADNLQLSAIPSNPKKMNGVPRNALMRPEDAEHRLGNQNFALGDRVVYVARTGKVPIAFRGTVVGISRTPTAKLLDVVFDVTFMSGTTLGDRCPPFRGQTVPATTLLNLTNHQVVAGSKAQVARQPVSPSVTTLTAHGGYHMNGKRYQDAAAPPPLQGSWRGALNGGNRGGGGRGGNAPQRGPIHGNLPYRPHSQQQQQQPDGLYQPSPVHVRGGRGGGQFRGRGGGGSPFRGGGRGGGFPGVDANGIPHPASAPPVYSAVPPPAILDAPSSRGGRGGRGRGGGGGGGRGRGDGQGFRGRGGGRGGAAQGQNRPQQQQQQQQQAAAAGAQG